MLRFYYHEFQDVIKSRSKEKNVVVCQNIDIMMKREIVKTTKYFI